jgi:hypothetical protein
VSQASLNAGLEKDLLEAEPSNASILRGKGPMGKTGTGKKWRLCSVKGCGLKHYAKGWCRAHYDRVKRTGNAGRALIGHAFFNRTLRSDNLRRPELSEGLMANLISWFRLIPSKGKAA